ncbi:hypothetical protein ACPV5A_24000 [Vibrio chagasii]|uniref:hypothetical protein n=1 Tax=Vibrio chagasii TaxID=170679 RepID=UPI003381A30A|nr:exported hypothetical protein [Vibrio chagasii]CAH7188430.1 exported hypothetical protein [Vibrio chagasii]
MHVKPLASLMAILSFSCHATKVDINCMNYENNRKEHYIYEPDKASISLKGGDFYNTKGLFVIIPIGDSVLVEEPLAEVKTFYAPDSITTKQEFPGGMTFVEPAKCEIKVFKS